MLPTKEREFVETLHLDEQEHRQSFDLLASVRMMRHDLDETGRVLPETLERIYDEELSYLAEGVDKAARTVFALRREGDELVYFNRGQWRPYVGMLLTGQSVACKEASQDSRRQFLSDKADKDLHMGYQMQKLRPGQRLSWYSPYPYEIEKRYGKKFLAETGFIPSRKMGFIYQAICQADGSVTLETQTVDRSDDEAFKAALDPGIQTLGMMSMVDAYDAVLARKHGEQFYAGRVDSERHENAWQSILRQKDLIDYFLSHLETIARSGAEGRLLEDRVKRHVYGVWAAFKNRLDGKKFSTAQESAYGFSAQYGNTVALEIQSAFYQFAAEGRVLIGCGGEINLLEGEANILAADSKDIFDAIFSGSSEETGGSDKFGPLKFKCKYGHWNERPRNKLIPDCKVPSCRNSVGC